MLHPEKKVALPQIREFYYTLVKMNEGYFKAKVDRHEFHLRSGHITQLLGVLNDGDKIYFYNVQLSIS